MKKIILIFSIVLSAILMSGGLFFLGSRGPVEPVELSDASPAEETFELAEFYQNQGHFDEAYSLLRQVLDLPLSSQLQLEASYRLGSAFLEDYLHNGMRVLDSAEVYLRSVFSTAADDDDFRLNAGKKLMKIAAVKKNSKRFFDLADLLLTLDLTDEDVVELWARRFDYIFDSGLPWSVFQENMVLAGNLPSYGPSGQHLIEDVRLRADERLLNDSIWFDEYARTANNQSPFVVKNRLFEGVSGSLADQMSAAAPVEKGALALRLGLAMVAMGDFDGAKSNLRKCLESDASPELIPAMDLISHLIRERGDDIELQQFVTQLVYGRNYSGFQRDEKLRIVHFLSDLQRYGDALKVIEMDLKMIAPGTGAEELIAEAVILETMQGQDEAARKGMDQLLSLGVSEEFGRALSAVIDHHLSQNDYDLVEQWGLRYLRGVPSDSPSVKEILFALFDAAYWLDKPVLEKLYIGAIAVQASPNDERVAPVILRMAGFVEEIGLPTLAGTYYNRIGLLSFFQKDKDLLQPNRNIGELAMLGKARCLKQTGDWVRADHLFRDLCNRTSSPLIRSEVAINWAELSLRFGQRREARRRFNLADSQLLSPELRARYLLGQALLRSEEMVADGPGFEEALTLLQNIQEKDRKQATVDFFNETFDFLFEQKNERVIRRLVDLAYQSEYADALPINSYVLRMEFGAVSLEDLGELNDKLQQIVLPDDAAMLDLVQVVRRIEKLSQVVALHSKRSAGDE